MIGGRRYWRVPVMDGEFVVEDSDGVAKARRRRQPADPRAATPTRRSPAAEAAVAAMRALPDVIMPFPGGVVRSGSKIGSKYKGADRPRPTTPSARRSKAGRRRAALPAEVACVLEIVIDGLTEADVGRRHARRACAPPARSGAAAACCAISAGNYGGKLGPYHFHLRKLLA